MKLWGDRVKRKHILLIYSIGILLALGLMFLNLDDKHIRLGAVIIMATVLIADVIDSATKIIVHGLYGAVIYAKYYLAAIFLIPALGIIFLTKDWEAHLIIVGIIVGISDIYNTLFFISWSKELDFEYRHANIRWTIFAMPPKFLIAGLLFYIGGTAEYQNNYYDHRIKKFNDANVDLAGKIAIAGAIIYFILLILTIVIDLVRRGKITTKDDKYKKDSCDSPIIEDEEYEAVKEKIKRASRMH